jgi:hypothetical protein
MSRALELKRLDRLLARGRKASEALRRARKVRAIFLRRIVR